MDTTVILLVVCLALIAMTLIMMIGFCCMFRAYLRRRPERDRYKPSYTLESVYSQTEAQENQGFTLHLQEKKKAETHNGNETKKSDGNKNEIIANT